MKNSHFSFYFLCAASFFGLCTFVLAQNETPHAIIRVASSSEIGQPDGDGLSWTSPFYSISNAVEVVSALGGGEVWIQKGIYDLTSPIDAKSNVTLIGGFSGLADETPLTASTNALETILNGDLNHDSTWQAKNNANKGAIWNWDSPMPIYNEPNPSEEEQFWRPILKNSDNTTIGITNTVAIDNFVLQGLTLNGFKRQAISFGLGEGGNISISNCAFTANLNESGDGIRGNYSLIFREYSVSIIDSTFLGNHHCLNVQNATFPVTNRLFRCVFRNNTTAIRQTHQVLFDGAQSSVEVSDCQFIKNAGTCYYGGGTIALCVDGNEATIENCLFQENRNYANSRGTLALGSMKNFVNNCRFIGNYYLCPDNGYSPSSACIATFGNNKNGQFLVENCIFQDNHMDIQWNKTNGKSKMVLGVVYAAARGNVGSFLNCTFLKNRLHVETAENVTSTNYAGIFAGRSRYPRTYLVNCLIADSEIEGPIRSCQGELSIEYVTLINSIFRNQTANYTLWTDEIPTSEVPYVVNVINSVVNGIPEDFPYEKTSHLAFDNNAIFDPSPAIRSGVVTDDTTGVQAMVIKATSPYKNSGVSIWRGNDGFPYALTKIQRLARLTDLIGCQNGNSTMENAESLYGIVAERDLVGDAFGDPRKLGKIPLGPLNPASSSSVLIVE